MIDSGEYIRLINGSLSTYRLVHEGIVNQMAQDSIDIPISFILTDDIGNEICKCLYTIQPSGKRFLEFTDDGLSHNSTPFNIDLNSSEYFSLDINLPGDEYHICAGMYASEIIENSREFDIAGISYYSVSEGGDFDIVFRNYQPFVIEGSFYLDQYNHLLSPSETPDIQILCDSYFDENNEEVIEKNIIVTIAGGYLSRIENLGTLGNVGNFKSESIRIYNAVDESTITFFYDENDVDNPHLLKKVITFDNLDPNDPNYQKTYYTSDLKDGNLYQRNNGYELYPGINFWDTTNLRVLDGCYDFVDEIGTIDNYIKISEIDTKYTKILSSDGSQIIGEIESNIYNDINSPLSFDITNLSSFINFITPIKNDNKGVSINCGGGHNFIVPHSDTYYIINNVSYRASTKGVSHIMTTSQAGQATSYINSGCIQINSNDIFPNNDTKIDDVGNEVRSLKGTYQLHYSREKIISVTGIKNDGDEVYIQHQSQGSEQNVFCYDGNYGIVRILNGTRFIEPNLVPNENTNILSYSFGEPLNTVDPSKPYIVFPSSNGDWQDSRIWDCYDADSDIITSYGNIPKSTDTVYLDGYEITANDLTIEVVSITNQTNPHTHRSGGCINTKNLVIKSEITNYSNCIIKFNTGSGVSSLLINGNIINNQGHFIIAPVGTGISEADITIQGDVVNNSGSILSTTRETEILCQGEMVSNSSSPIIESIVDTASNFIPDITATFTKNVNTKSSIVSFNPQKSGATVNIYQSLYLNNDTFQYPYRLTTTNIYYKDSLTISLSLVTFNNYTKNTEVKYIGNYPNIPFQVVNSIKLSESYPATSKVKSGEVYGLDGEYTGSYVPSTTPDLSTYPVVGNVLKGIVYGPNNEFVGTLEQNGGGTVDLSALETMVSEVYAKVSNIEKNQATREYVVAILNSVINNKRK